MANAESIQLETARLKLALKAAWQIEGLAEVMIELLDHIADSKIAAAQSMAARVRLLSGIVMSAIDDEEEPAADIKQRLDGI